MPDTVIEVASQAPTDADSPEGRAAPVVLDAKALDRNEKEKIRRLVMPKKNTGHLEVPQDIMDLWNTAAGKEKLYEMWAKSGGIKAVANVVISDFARQSSRSTSRS